MNESTNDNPEVEVREVNSEVFLDIWLDGFSSGMATLILNASAGHDDAPPDDVQAQIVQRTVEKIMDDPAAMETARQKIFARLLGKPQYGTTTLNIAALDTP
ncbi:Uncharacterised protein [Mycobacteroides abscessus subsp. bolletii]|uniref:hypothetical protein n=1 Tax=Mycobacteroides abscessus TaxID=36809 RepID=UPI0009A8B572|nr:hypothetical protein [Mycobacteroides abscessus]SKR94489.1 Uncharacterised protein [Mycobacteroides abscessus subsp. bolletii]SKS03086.1 Uncharacterised protein [Mycobacteroides abscessus subsp. bolletii]DAZ90113.1 TPA_asm: hypothetical protein PROPHIFVLQ01-1_26 [Mycobacterium phage prophiFVLQ01-1]